MKQESTSKRVLLIAGPTASGKSALAIASARERNGVVINADAMQVYRELRVITARPSVEEEAMVPHRMYGYVSGADDYSTGQWLRNARTEIENCWRDGKLPIVVGGTGLYFKALEQGLAEVPEVEPEIRQRWREQSGELHPELMKRDPELAARLEPGDLQRIRRALEVIESTGYSLLYWQKQGAEHAILQGADIERVLVDVERQELYARADRRLDQMVEMGALKEIALLPEWSAMKPIMKAIGVPEFKAHLKGEISLEEALRLAKIATRQYIKRQLTWWRGQGRYFTSD